MKLVIQSGIDPTGTGRWEQCFDKDVVTIGRASSNDLNLQDPRRVVSSRHAEIRRMAQHCVLVDVGSTNGTIVNDQRVAPAKEYPLQQGDRIRIGDFTIQFDPIPLPDVAVSEVHGPAPVAAGGAGPIDETEHEPDLLYTLGRIFAAVSRRGADERVDALLDALREVTRGLNANQTEKLLHSVETRFQVTETSCRPVFAPHHEVEPGAAETAYEECVRIARKYCQDLDVPVSSEIIGKLMSRIDQVLQVTVNSLSDAVRGRRQFEREFEVEATRILAWTPNRIKLAEDGQEIGAYLLDPRPSDATMETMVADLEGVFGDLALHQLGLVAGFRECVRGLLNQFDPMVFEDEPPAKPLRVGPFTLPRVFSCFLESAAWRRFKQKHRQLSEEEVKVFESILAPYFAKGYLSVQKAKTHH